MLWDIFWSFSRLILCRFFVEHSQKLCKLFSLWSVNYFLLGQCFANHPILCRNLKMPSLKLWSFLIRYELLSCRDTQFPVFLVSPDQVISEIPAAKMNYTKLIRSRMMYFLSLVQKLWGIKQTPLEQHELTCEVKDDPAGQVAFAGERNGLCFWSSSRFRTLFRFSQILPKK